MKVHEYRDLIDEVLRMASDLKACVNDEERALWTKRAERLRLRAWSLEGTAGRATAADKARMQRAKDTLDVAFQSVIHLVIGDRQLLGI
jgi:hypothetical protein